MSKSVRGPGIVSFIEIFNKETKDIKRLEQSLFQAAQFASLAGQS
jgi:hypothetical protein